jgi:hypothetical protein
MAQSQFTLRSMFVGMVIAAIAAWVMYQAGTGSPWARGATFGMFALVILVVTHLAIFLAVGTLGYLSQAATGERTQIQTQNPFATAAPPPRPLPAEME